METNMNPYRDDDLDGLDLDGPNPQVQRLAFEITPALQHHYERMLRSYLWAARNRGDSEQEAKRYAFTKLRADLSLIEPETAAMIDRMIEMYY
jgi:hypothetical protein